MVTSGKRPAGWLRLACFALVVVLAAACSGGGGTSKAGLPDPAPGKVATFDVDRLSAKYHLYDSTDYQWTVVTSDQKGNVYLADTFEQASYVYRITPEGDVSRSPKPLYVGHAGALVVRADGSMVFGATEPGGDLVGYRKNGEPADVALPPGYKDPQLIGQRPDGSLVVSEQGNFWAVKDGQGTLLYRQQKPVRNSAVVDAGGTLHTAQDGFADVEAVPMRGKPHRVRVSGSEPVTGKPLDGFDPVRMASAGQEGFYAIATDAQTSEYVMIRVADGSTGVLSRQSLKGRSTCVPGKQYPALHNACEPQNCLARSGSRLLLMCSLSPGGTGRTHPALVVRAPAS